MTSSEAIRVLEPRPLGDDWSAYLGVSPYGALRRAWRANALQRSNLRSVLGITVLRGDDLFNRTLSSDVIKKRLSELFPTLDTQGWHYTDWWPIAGPVPREAFNHALRECSQCARTGYHMLLFQMPGVTQCPWHGCRLISNCTRCGLPLQAGLREDRPPGQCICGHDLVSFVSAITGEARAASRIQDYLSWAVQAHGRYWLLAPEQHDPLATHALDLLLPHHWDKTPSSSQLRCQGGHVLREMIDFDGPRHRMSPRLSKKSGLETFRSGTACLPIEWASEFRAVGQNLLKSLPSEARRQAAKKGTDLAWTISTLPVVAAGNTLFLQTECFERSTLRMIAKLASGLGTSSSGTRPAADQFERWVRQHPLGTVILEQVLKRILLRGYSDGARVALGRHVASLYDRDRARPAVRLPWVLIYLPTQACHMPKATLVWTKQAGTL